MLKKSKKLFYEYLSKKINTYFEEFKEEKAGNSYYLQFDEETEVDAFYDELRSLNNAQSFQDGKYTSFFLNSANGNKTLVAAASSNLRVTEAFLVTLRNLIKNQTGLYSNLNVLFLFCNYDLDSITNGAQSLLDMGMPLSFQKLTEEMEKDITSSLLNFSEKKIIHFDISKKLENTYQNSIFDLEQDLSFLTKDHLDTEDYNEIGLFPDSFSEDLSDANISKRCEKNSELYGHLAIAHNNNEAKNFVDKNYEGTSSILSKLKNDTEWKKVDYDVTAKCWDNMHQNGAKLRIDSELIVDNEKGYDCIDNPKGSSNASARNRNVIIFNPQKLSQCIITIPFDSVLPSKSYIKIADQTTKIVSDPKDKCDLLLLTEIQPNETSFKKISINIGKNRSIPFTLNICFIPLTSELFNMKKDFIVNVKNSNSSIQFAYSENSLFIGNQNDLIDDLNAEDIAEESYIIPENKGVELTPELIEKRQDIGNINADSPLNIILNDIVIPFQFTYSTNTVKQIKLNDIILEKIDTNSSVERNNRNIFLNGMTYMLSSKEELAKIELEEEMIENNVLFGAILDFDEDNKILNFDIAIPDEIKESYLNILNYFMSNNHCPILAKIDIELLQLYEIHIQNYINFFEKIRENNGYMLKKQTEEDLLLLGSLIDGSSIRFTSLNIVSIIQQYNFFNELFAHRQRSILEQIPSSIFSIFNGLGLLPLFSINKNFFGNNEKRTTKGTYNAISENQAAFWIKYTKIDIKVEDGSNKYLDKIVKSKLSEFRMHYAQLFDINSDLPMVINAVKLGSNIEFLKGILLYIRSQWIHKNEITVIPIIVNFYSNNNDTSIFDYFLGESDLTNIIQHIPIELFMHKGYDEREVLRLYQHSIKYYHYFIENENLKNAHITFVNRDNNDTKSVEAMDNIPTGLSLGGLISSISSRQPKDNEARFGFGLGGLTPEKIENSDILKLTKYLNEYSYAQSFNASYVKDQCLVMIPSNSNTDFINKIYDYSEWVTYINPHFGVDYFYNSKDLLIIHYSDQLQNSENYDAITVTKKVDIFRKIIREELKGTKTFNSITEKQVNDFITLTTCINGNWLLNLMITDDNFKTRASFSEIATYKIMMAFLQHPDILWIPISLEEILRIAGDQRIGDESIFKNLKAEIEKGMENKCYSDDILMVGIETSKINDDIKIHIYPVEVKASEAISYAQLQKKGIKQAQNTVTLFDKAFIEYTNEKSPLLKKFYKQFFMNLTLINARKLILSKTIDFDLDALNALRGKLLNDDFTVTKSLDSLIGKGCVTIFSNQNEICSFSLQDNDLAILNMPIDYMRNDVLNSIPDLRNQLLEGKWDTLRNSCISNSYTDFYREKFIEAQKTQAYDDNIVDDEDEDRNANDGDFIKPNLYIETPPIIAIKPKQAEVGSDEDIVCPEQNSNEVIPLENSSEIIPIDEVRIFLGQDMTTGNDVYWEYGNSDLANHHAVVTGTSGQGKSYALQCLLLEFSHKNVNSIIIDYSDSFVDGKLEPIFKNTLLSYNKFKQFNIYKSGLAINPFKKGSRKIGGELILDGPEDVAARFANIICKIYKLGQQQFSSIYQAVKEGIIEFGDDMSLRILNDILNKDTSSSARTVVSKLQLFFDKDPFNYQHPIDWNTINKRNGICYLFELEGYTEEMREVLSDFILWDLYNYKMSLDDNNLPLPIVLDEVQNLSRGKDSPTYKILNEGRKHKIGGIFVTQSLMSRFDEDTVNSFLNSSEKIYFTPPDKAIKEMAGFLNHADKSKDKNRWADMLANNPKRSCFVNGLFLDCFQQTHANNVSHLKITSIEDRISKWEDAD